MRLAILVLSFLSLGADWPQFRGPNGNGIVPFDMPTNWSKEYVKWEVAIPGSGWAQPVVVGDAIFIVTAVSDPPLTPKDMMSGVRDPRSMPKKTGKPAPGPNVKIDWQLLKYDLKTGKLIWTKTISSGKPAFGIHPSNTYATETPCADASRVYSLFGATGILTCHDHDGKELWRKDFGPAATNADLGTGASTALADGKLFVPLFNESAGTLLCLEAATGNQLWKAERQKGTSWSTPFIWSNSKRKEVVACSRGLVTSHDINTGKELWRIGGIDSSFSSSPAATSDYIVFGNGGPGSVSPLFAVKAGAEGDITLKKGEASSQYVSFYKTGAAPGMSSPIAIGEYVYVLNNGGLACYELSTGKQLYKERLPKVRTITAAALASRDRIYFQDETGLTVTIKTGPEFEVLTTNQLKDLFWSSPAPTGQGILLRGLSKLYYITQ